MQRQPYGGERCLQAQHVLLADPFDLSLEAFFARNDRPRDVVLDFLEKQRRIAREQKPLVETRDGDRDVGLGDARLRSPRIDAVRRSVTKRIDLTECVERLEDVQAPAEGDREIVGTDLIAAARRVDGRSRHALGAEGRADSDLQRDFRPARRIGLQLLSFGLRPARARRRDLGVLAERLGDRVLS
jgi:hypothetical protein